MYAVLLSTALFTPAQPPGTSPPAGADRGTAADRTAAGAAGNVSLDGNWTVISLERNGQPVPNAASMTVTVRGNTVTFDAGKATGGAEPNQMRAMRLDFGRNGQLYVTEANADGKFGTGGTGSGTGGSGTGTDRSGTGSTTGSPPSGTNPRDNGTAGRPGDDSKFPTPAGGGAGAIPAGSKSGVYVLTQDFFAVCIHEEAGRTGSPGTDRPGTGTDRPNPDKQPLSTQRPSATDVPVPDRPATDRAGTDTDRAGTGGTQPRAPGDRAADRGSAAGGMMPQSRSYCTVILKRAGGAGQPGNTRPNTDR